MDVSKKKKKKNHQLNTYFYTVKKKEPFSRQKFVSPHRTPDIPEYTRNIIV